MCLTNSLHRSKAHIAELNGVLKEGVVQRGFKLATRSDARHHGAMIAIKSSDMHRFVGKLAESDIITSCRDNNLRIAPHIYNNCADIERLLNALSNNRSLLA